MASFRVEAGAKSTSVTTTTRKEAEASFESPNLEASDDLFCPQSIGRTSKAVADGGISSADDFPTLLTCEESAENQAAFAKDADKLQQSSLGSSENIASMSSNESDSPNTPYTMNCEAMTPTGIGAGRERHVDRVNGGATTGKRRSRLALCRSICARFMAHVRRQHLLSEASGALGDVGTYIPFAFGYNDKNIFAFDFLLVGSGLFNVATGYFFKVPMPVQPMKTIGAVALTEKDVTVYEVISAGLFVGFCTFIVGILLGIEKLTGSSQQSMETGIQNPRGEFTVREAKSSTQKSSTVGLIPIEKLLKSAPSMIAGIQVALGIKLGMKGYQSISRTNILGYSDTWTFGFPVLALMFMCNFLTEHDKLPKVQIPVALIVFVLGLIVARIRMNELPSGANLTMDHGSIATTRLHPDFDSSALSDTSTEFGIDFYNFIKHSIVNPDSGGFIFLRNLYQGFLSRGWSMGLAQLPLTLLNSVFSVSDWSEKKFGTAKKATTREIAVSVGAMNMIGTSFGFMPMCHGAGGLVAQSKFGAKSGLAVKMLGWGKIILGLTIGKLLLRLMKCFPDALLGNMLVVVGVELAITGIQGVADLKNTTAEEKRRKAKEMFVCFFSIMVQLKTNTGIGFLSGAITWGLLWGMENMVQTYVNRKDKHCDVNAASQATMDLVEAQTVAQERVLIIEAEKATDEATWSAADAASTQASSSSSASAEAGGGAEGKSLLQRL